jgi:molybdopterin/thiamine biosynthesis adenylyltransferase
MTAHFTMVADGGRRSDACSRSFTRGAEGVTELSTDSTAYQAVILDEGLAEDSRILDQLRLNPVLQFLDHRPAQLAALRALRAAPARSLTAEPTRWAYYPWRRTVVGVLGPLGFRAVRLDRNRHLITTDEQARLARLRIGVAGLSAGHVIAHTLAAQGLCGALKVADFDILELSNLNRVPATVLDLGVNKATLTARRIAELDPYLRVEVYPEGLTGDNVGRFLDGLDLVVEECDSLDMKVTVREEARRRTLPVLMATSDRGLVDIERFDLESDRPVLHGLIGDPDALDLADMASRDKIPYVLALLEVPEVSAKIAASMVEIDQTLSTWPQLTGEVILGATAIAEAVRRIGLGEQLPSGRVRIDVTQAFSRLADPATMPGAAKPPSVDEPWPATAPQICDVIAAAVLRAPSGGNMQPWDIEVWPNAVVIRLRPHERSAMDVGSRGGAVAVGAALFNARVAAAAHGLSGVAEFRGDGDEYGLTAVLNLAGTAEPGAADHELARWYPDMLRRETNRHKGAPDLPLDANTVMALQHAARREGARLRLLTDPAHIETAAAILGEADRLRYLTPRLHTEMISELRFPDSPEQDTGIDVRALELSFADRAVLEILRRPDVMAQLASWDAGVALGDRTRELVRASSALGIVIVAGHDLRDYARGGSALEAVWIAANSASLGVHPVSPMFMYALTDDEIAEMAPGFAPAVLRLRHQLQELVGVAPGESPVLVFRLAVSPPASGRSRRSLARIRRREG